MLRPDDIPEQVRAICVELRNRGFCAWVVGGSVRDLLRGAPAKDWDVATSAKPSEIQQAFRRTVPTGIEHGTVTVLLGDDAYEVTTLRGEGAYADGRRPSTVEFLEDIEGDLARRDFTVNAIAYDPLADAITDPFGGCRDIEARVLRAVGRARDRFDEDGLRALRAARFAATLEFELEEETKAAIRQTLGTFKRVSHERVRDEWTKALKARVPSRAFTVMADTGLLGAISEELEKSVGCEQNKYHAYDVWRHSLECMDALPAEDPVLRLAGLLHDIGKPRTRAMGANTNDWTFYNHDSVGAELADRWMREFRYSNEERARVTHLVRHHLVCYSDEWSDAAVRRFMKRVGREAIDPLIQLARADAIGKGRDVSADLSALERLLERVASVNAAGSALSVRDLAVNGSDIMKVFGLPPGRVIGEVLEKLLETVLERPEANERDELLTMARTTIESLAATASATKKAPS